MQEASRSVPAEVSSGVSNNGSIVSVANLQRSGEDECLENSDTRFSGDCSTCNPQTPRIITKAFSLPFLVSYSGLSISENMVHVASCTDLNVFNSKHQGTVVHKIGTQVDGGGDHNIEHKEKTSIKNPADDNYTGYNYVVAAKDWIMPAMDEVNILETNKAKPTLHHEEELPINGFKMKRIKDWVMDLQHCNPSEENYELSTSRDYLGGDGVTVLDGLPTARQDGKNNPVLEVSAKKYISSLSVTATSAQLASHGLVAIPPLSTFVSLKTLNLSGNAIVRITAGALPRGLHTLNLSKNTISTMDGLRKLTRLRVLDLSYNRISRIGQGLASCSYLKELYLAGNKISEVEGLHRLQKLNVLDLRFNKLSTTKCLGQLAANYNSLQTISLEGNPAQKNVGDEQLKRYLQGLLPHLADFNKTSIKAGTLKDSADRSVRLSLSAHQIDRDLRTELKTMQKGYFRVAPRKKPSSPVNGQQKNHQVVASTKPSSNERRCLPPSGMKTVIETSICDCRSKLLSFRPDVAMCRSRRKGTLEGVFR